MKTVKRKYLKVIYLLPLLLISPASMVPAESTYTIPRLVQYSFTLQNKTAQVIKNAEFWTYAPVKQTAFQRCEQVKSSHPYKKTTDSLGNQILHYKIDMIPPFGSKIISITANLMLADKANPIVLRDRQAFTKSEKYIEADHLDISNLAKDLKEPTVLKSARNSFQWSSDHIKYARYIAQDRGALYALKHRKGDCTEYMHLFVALCRANQIPARGIGGYICRSNCILKPSEYHNWAEFYDAGTWNSVDPQNKVFMENSSDYIAMRIIGDTADNPMGSFHRFRFTGEGLKVRMNR